MGVRDRFDGDVASSRTWVARYLSVGAPLAAAGVLTFAFFAPPSWSPWRIVVFVSAALWLAWVLWGWPKIEVRANIVIVRNGFLTWTFGLRQIHDVEGGRKLSITLADGRIVTAAAVSGDGLAIEAWRRIDGYTEGGHFIRSADDTRISRGPESSAASWATYIRHRVRDAPPAADIPVTRRMNWPIIAGSAATVALVLLVITVLD